MKFIVTIQFSMNLTNNSCVIESILVLRSILAY